MLRNVYMVAILAFVCASPAAGALPDQSGFSYDRRQAIDLGLGYATPLAQIAEKSGAKLDLGTPTVLARTFKGNRHLILISYGSNREDVSATVTLEQPSGSAKLAFVNWSFSNGCRDYQREMFENATSDTPYSDASKCPQPQSR